MAIQYPPGNPKMGCQEEKMNPQNFLLNQYWVSKGWLWFRGDLQHSAQYYQMWKNMYLEPSCIKIMLFKESSLSLLFSLTHINYNQQSNEMDTVCWFTVCLLFFTKLKYHDKRHLIIKLNGWMQTRKEAKGLVHFPPHYKSQIKLSVSIISCQGPLLNVFLLFASRR